MTRAATETIKCECCRGTGIMTVHMAERPEDDITGPCLMCHGTGFERADVTARKRVEGVSPDGK